MKTITQGLPQGSALSPVLFNVYTVGITSINWKHQGVLSASPIMYLCIVMEKDRQAIADSVQEELNRLDNWCNEGKGRIHPDKACVLWCSLNNRVVKATMPTVTIEGKELQREDTLKYLGTTFDRSLCGNEHVSRIIVKARKDLVALKTMAGA